MKHGVFTTLLNPNNSQEEVMTWFKGQKVVPRINKCLDNAGDYVEK
jgi:hypothetical protein